MQVHQVQMEANQKSVKEAKRKHRHSTPPQQVSKLLWTDYGKVGSEGGTVNEEGDKAREDTGAGTDKRGEASENAGGDEELIPLLSETWEQELPSL